eukprot:UN04758
MSLSSEFLMLRKSVGFFYSMRACIVHIPVSSNRFIFRACLLVKIL